MSTQNPLIVLSVALAAVAASAQPVPGPGGEPDYFGKYPNYANSPLRFVAPESGAVSPGLRKFIDELPIPAVARPDTTSYPRADFYVIALVEYRAQMHTDLPAVTGSWPNEKGGTRLRGYVQLPSDAKGCPTGLADMVAPPQYFGPMIQARRDVPVRVKFYNCLPVGSGGDLFLPTDTSYAGAGPGPDAWTGVQDPVVICAPAAGGTKPAACYTENRATLHLHGATNPWISDGTPHQWITPAGEDTKYPQGVSVVPVPDMPEDLGDPHDGMMTFYYSNQQSARLTFYHDQSYGITRLNVYAGEAGGYWVTDAVERALIDGGTIPGTATTVRPLLPGLGIPLVIQDKTFVPDDGSPFANFWGDFPSQLAAQDPTWNVAKWGGPGSLWFPHVYMPNQNPAELDGANVMGRWDYGPWFWPPAAAAFPLRPNVYCLPTHGTDCTQSPGQPPYVPGTPSISGVPNAFMDTPVVNGKAYPVLHVAPGPVRLRILNGANDRFWNLSLFVADPGVATVDGRRDTEVRMVPFDRTQTFPSRGSWFGTGWGTPDNRDGGVPDPATRGPAMIQIGGDGGFLPAPVIIGNQPVNYDYNTSSATFLNVKEHALLLAPGERADVVVDFSAFAGRTLILYNDAPAPLPSGDSRYDYYTGGIDQTEVGGAPTTLPGFGPNTRTIMQIVVGGSGGSAPFDGYSEATLSAMKVALAAAFAASQDTIVVPQAPYNAAYAGNFPGGADAYVRIQDTAHSFRPIGTAGTDSCQLRPPPSGCVTVQMEPKTIVEEFSSDYGRMSTYLGIELPFTGGFNQTVLPLAYVDPPTELVQFTDPGTPIGTPGDGTQLWKITHNGVDTHAIHFGPLNVQLVNRVSWDGAIRPPEPNELGWKDTVRMNPLEDTIVALRPAPLARLPFAVPVSLRPLAPHVPPGSNAPFTSLDALGNPTTFVNQVSNFGWEYAWLGRQLGEQEHGAMRPLTMAVAPRAPTGLSATLNGTAVSLNWTDNSSSTASSFRIDRANDLAFSIGLASNSTADGRVTSFTDPNPCPGRPICYYRVAAIGTIGSTVRTFPTMNVASGFSNVAPVPLPVPPPAAPTNLTATLLGPPPGVQLRFTDNATNEQQFGLERCVGTACTTLTVGARAGTGMVSFADLSVLPGADYLYRVYAQNANGNRSAYSNEQLVNVPAIPAPPSNVLAVAPPGRVGTIVLTWTSPASNQAGFQLQRSASRNFANPTNVFLSASAFARTQSGLERAKDYYFRIRSYNRGGWSVWVTATPLPVRTR